MNIFIGMETSGVLRTRFQAQGHFVISADLLPPEDGGWADGDGGHVQGDVFQVFNKWYDCGHRFDMAIFHPDCTYMTNSAAWAFKDPDYDRYPGIGYHQKVKDGTLVGAERREAREKVLADVRRLDALPVPRKCFENPIGAIIQAFPADRLRQIVQPFQHGDDASKATVLVLDNLPPLEIDPAKFCEPRMVCKECGAVHAAYIDTDSGLCRSCREGECLPRWANQTDSGQNCLSPGADRWKNRSRTYPGIADAIVARWGNLETMQ